jgi:hypothetical protein
MTFFITWSPLTIMCRAWPSVPLFRATTRNIVILLRRLNWSTVASILVRRSVTICRQLTSSGRGVSQHGTATADDV